MRWRWNDLASIPGREHCFPWVAGEGGVSRKVPPAWLERLHRWWHRKGYRQLPPFYQDFYPFHNALSLTLQSAKHAYESGKAMDELASKYVRRVADMERTIAELRLAVAQSGWNEDRVDRFMSQWFGRKDLATAPGEVE